MLSRVADRVYWMSRYLERAENLARLVDVYGKLLLDLPEGAGVGWEDVFLILAIEGFIPDGGEGGEREALRVLLSDGSRPYSLVTTLANARENARTTRDVVPTEAWRTVNQLHQYASERLPIVSARADVLERIIDRCHQVCGILDGTMAHGPPYQLVRLGRNLERADMISRMIDVAATALMSGREEIEPFEDSLWNVALRSVSAYQAYRQSYSRPAMAEGVIAFLLQDTDFPRSIVHCTDRMQQALALLPGGEGVRRELESFASRVAELDAAKLTAADLHAEMDRFQLDLAGLHRVVSETWLNPGHSA